MTRRFFRNENGFLDFPTVLPSALAILLILCWKLFFKNPHGLPYPPGPKGQLLVGHQHGLPIIKPWIACMNWGKLYGNIIHFRVFNKHTLILNSLDDAIELFEKNSRSYSDRPVVPIVDMMSWDFNAALIPYGAKWRRHRRMFQQSFRPEASATYRPTQQRKVNDMLQGLLASPHDFRAHYRTFAAAIVMSTLYGYDISPTNDCFVDLAEQAVGQLAEILFPGAAAVNAIPFLRHIPAWFPGAGFKRFANEAKNLTDQLKTVPLNFAKEAAATGNGPQSLVAELLEKNKADANPKDGEDVIKGVAATSYAAGADTTVSAVGTFFLAMALFPDVQKKAQEEIDCVIGTRRLPDFDDRESLPYCEALYREVMRWRPPLPLNVSHSASKGSIYKGYFVPKGAAIIANICFNYRYVSTNEQLYRAMAHDESIYRQPDVFNPDRFMTQDGQVNDNDTILAFGFGRRVCVGRHMASATIWLSIVSTLATFNICKAKDAHGKEIPIDAGYTGGFISHPLPYKCSIMPRSQEARKLVMETAKKN